MFDDPSRGAGGDDSLDAAIVGAGFAGLCMLHRLRGLGLSHNPPLDPAVQAEVKASTDSPGAPAKPENARRIAMIGRSDRPNSREIGWCNGVSER